MRINRPGQSERGAGWLTITVLLLFLYVDAAAATSAPSQKNPASEFRQEISERGKSKEVTHWDSHKVQKSGLLKDLDNIGMDAT